MKRLLKKKRGKLPFHLLIASLMASAASSAQAANVAWTGASPNASMLWSDPDNWSASLTPSPIDIAVFSNEGSASEIGMVNNVVDSDTTITALTYSAAMSPISLVTNYHTTLVNPGVTLSLNRGSAGGALMFIGNNTDPLNHDNAYYYNITGAGGSLIAGNIESPSINQGVQVTATQRNGANHIGSLDLSGLDNFSLAGGYFWVGINGAEGTIQTDRPAGRVLLAKTNLIIMAGNAYDTLNLGSFRVGESRANTPNTSSILELGQENNFYTPWLKIGGARTGNGAAAQMYFRQGLSQPTLKLRGTDGVGRLGDVRIGDNSFSTSASSIASRGIVDLSGGVVDALIDVMYVGRGPGGNDSLAAGATASGTGVLTWTEGTFDVNTLLLGYQFGNNRSINSGTLNVNGPNAKLIAGRLVVGRDAGANAGGGVGILNIDGGTVEINTYLAKNLGGPNVSGIVTLTNNGVLNLRGPGAQNPTVAFFDTLHYSSGTVTNGTLALTNLNVLLPATAFEVHPTTVLDPNNVGATGILTINGNLALKGGSLNVDVSDPGLFDQVNVLGDLSLDGTTFVKVNPLATVAAGSYPIMSYSSLSGTGGLQVSGPVADSRYTVGFDTTAPNVTMNIGGNVSSLSWSGGNNGNTWDLKSTTNWNGSTEAFYTYDAVDFGDSGVASPAVNLVGSLMPGDVTFSASQDYTFAGSGKISGRAGLTVNGSATFTISTTNDYSGGTTINGGTLVVGDGATTQGTLGTGAVTNNATLVFNPSGTQTNANVISGGGSVIKRGTGTTRLTGANTFTGPMTVEAGILQAGSTAAFGNNSISGGMVTVLSGATLDISGSALGPKAIMVTGEGVNGAGALINTASPQFMRDVQFDGDSVVGGTGGITIGSSSATSTDPGLTVYGHKLTKVGLNHLKIDCLRSTPWNLQLGDVDVQEGVLSLYGNLNLGFQPTSPITVRSNAALAFAPNAAFPLTKAVSLEDGACVLGLGAASAVNGTINLNGKGTFEIPSAMSLTVDSVISGGGPLVKGLGVHPSVAVSTGAGTLILSAANTFTGDLQIETGKVALTNDSSIDNVANVVLAGGTLDVFGRNGSSLTLVGNQSLRGNGSLIGSFTSPVGTTVAPRATNGLIAVTGSLTLRGTTVMDINRDAGPVNSRITVTGTLDCGGSLVITSSGGTFQSGDTFALFSAGTTLNPFENAAITFPALPTGLYWENKLAIDGTVVVAGSSEPATPPTVSATFAGNQLSIAWPSEYTSYILQGQTNAVGVGLTDTWYNVTGTANNQITIDLDSTGGSVFFRLVKP